MDSNYSASDFLVFELRIGETIARKFYELYMYGEQKNLQIILHGSRLVLIGTQISSNLLMTRKVVRRQNQSTRKFGRRLNLALNSKKLLSMFSSGSKGLITASHQFLTPIRS